MSKCLILCKLKAADEKVNVGFWILVPKEEEAETIKSLGERFIFSFDLNSYDATLVHDFLDDSSVSPNYFTD